MCDPIGMIGMAFSIGSSIMNMQAQQDLYNKQQAANDAWLAYQRRKAAEESARQERMHQIADVARNQTLDKMTGPEQKKAQTEEQQRVVGEIATMTGVPSEEQLAGDKALQFGLPGAFQNVSPEAKAGYYQAMTQASREARQRIANLATVASFTSSENNLANRAGNLFTQSGNVIKMQGDMRQGSLGAYAAEKQVEPIKYTMGGGGGAFGGIAQGLAGGAGRMIGAGMAGTPSV